MLGRQTLTHALPSENRQSSGSCKARINISDDCSSTHTTCFKVCPVCQPSYEQEEKTNRKKYTSGFWKAPGNYHPAPNWAWNYQNDIIAFGKPLKLTKLQVIPLTFSYNSTLYLHQERVMLHEQVHAAYCWRIFYLRSCINCSRLKLSHSLLWETGVPGIVQNRLSTRCWLWNNNLGKGMSLRDKELNILQSFETQCRVCSVLLHPFSVTEGFHDNGDTNTFLCRRLLALRGLLSLVILSWSLAWTSLPVMWSFKSFGKEVLNSLTYQAHPFNL